MPSEEQNEPVNYSSNDSVTDVIRAIGARHRWRISVVLFLNVKHDVVSHASALYALYKALMSVLQTALHWFHQRCLCLHIARYCHALPHVSVCIQGSIRSSLLFDAIVSIIEGYIPGKKPLIFVHRHLRVDFKHIVSHPLSTSPVYSPGGGGDLGREECYARIHVKEDCGLPTPYWQPPVSLHQVP